MDKNFTGKNSNSVQNVTPSKSTKTDSSLSTPAKSPKSPRGVWKTTKHGIKRITDWPIHRFMDVKCVASCCLPEVS